MFGQRVALFDNQFQIIAGLQCFVMFNRWTEKFHRVWWSRN